MNDVAVSIVVGSCACVGMICYCIQWTTNCVLEHKHVTQDKVFRSNESIMQYNMRVAMFNIKNNFTPDGSSKFVTSDNLETGVKAVEVTEIPV